MIYAIYSDRENQLQNIEKLKNVLTEYSDNIIIDSDLYVLFLHTDKKLLITIQLQPTEELLESSKGSREKPERIAEKYIFDVLTEHFNVLKVHMKCKTRTLFTINGLNCLIFSLTRQTQDELDYDRVNIPWENYGYRFIHMTNNILKLEKTELLRKFDIKTFDFKKELEEQEPLVEEEE